VGIAEMVGLFLVSHQPSFIRFQAAQSPTPDIGLNT
jgi:hypothetical protein